MLQTRISSRLAGLQCAMAQIITLGPADYNIQYGDWTGFSNVTSIRIVVTTCGSSFSPRPWDCINRYFLLWASVYPFWFVPVLHMQLITCNHSLTTHPCWPSAVKNLDNADSIFRILKHSTQLSCASCVSYNIRQLGVGKNPTDLRAIVIVIVPSMHTDTDTREFPR